MSPRASGVLRYHGALVALHWLVALLIAVELGVGYVGLSIRPNADPGKLDILQIHMAAGMAILALMVLWLVVRQVTARPAPTEPADGLEALVRTSHTGLYIVVIALAATGFATALLAGLPEIVFARSGAPLPPSLAVYPTRVAHGVLAALLLGLIVLHVFVAMQRGVGHRHGMLRRMLPGPRVAR